jgi:isopentenyl diphosphate isomerase/L-lactate dehydrogenase-like FMN-dependent dehydrogenase
MIEFLYGSYQKSKEMGTTWIEEMKEEMKFAMICHGNTKVIIWKYKCNAIVILRF